MPASKAKNLRSLMRTAVATKTRSATAAVAAGESTGVQLVSFVGASTASSSSSSSARSTENQSKACTKTGHHRPNKTSSLGAATVSALQKQKLETESPSGPDEPARKLSEKISSMLCGDVPSDYGSSLGSEFNDKEKSVDTALNIPWFSSFTNKNISLRRKEVSRERKHKWTFKNTQTNRLQRLVSMCGRKLGTEATLSVFGRLGRENGVKEYNALIALCIEKAKSTDDEEATLQQIYLASQVFHSMKEEGLQIEDETFGPFLMFLIDMGMTREFQFFCKMIKGENPSSFSRLGYYEMLLWIRVGDKEKIQELCNYIAANEGGDSYNILENYLAALCENDREEILPLLDIVDITRVTSADCVKSIFKFLGRMDLGACAEKFILALKTNDHGADSISNLIFDYVVSMPNIAVEDVTPEFKYFHTKVALAPASSSYGKVIQYCCDSLKVHAALDIVHQMIEAGIKVSLETLHSLLRGCEDSFEFNLVHQIYSLVRQHDLNPSNETFRLMINLSVKMKDFVGAYGMLEDLKTRNLIPTSSMYNAIMAGYFREKNIVGGLKILKEMESADVKPDTQTFTYLIGNSNCVEHIAKYHDDLMNAGVPVTKHIFMALINAYAACGEFEKAKQVVEDRAVPLKGFNDVRCVLVSALASHGQLSDALDVYEEIKNAGCHLEPKAIIALIERTQSVHELDRLLELLDELKDRNYWVDGCYRIILFCVQHKRLSTLINLFKQLMDKFCDDDLFKEVLFDEAFCHVAEAGSTHLQLGMDLLKAIKEEFGIYPSRKCLDFLLTASVNVKDLQNSQLIWEEYQNAGLPYNVLSFLRMYQVLVASGDHKSAGKFLNRIPVDDPHVRYVIKACQKAYIGSPHSMVGEKKKKKKKKKNEAR